MTTEQTAQQLELAAQILRTGHPFEVRHDTSDRWHASLGVNPAQAVLQDWHLRPVLATPPYPAQLHNPDNLTAEAVGVGYRLLTEDEFQKDAHLQHQEWWSICVRPKSWNTGEPGRSRVPKLNFGTTYRLPLSVPWPEPADPYAELKAAHAAGKVIECITGTDRRWMPVQGKPRWNLPVEDYRIKPEEPALQLPPPPPGMRWHREDGWKADDLPSGYRPLVVGEKYVSGDEYRTKYSKDWHPETFMGTHTGSKEVTQSESSSLRTTRPLTFEHAGKTWTYHRPGDPMPCDGDRDVCCLVTKGGHRETNSAKGRYMGWSVTDDNLYFWGVIIGWRYADEKKTAPLGPEDVPPGSVFRSKDQPTTTFWTVSQVWEDGFYLRGDSMPWDTARERMQINRSLSKGQWNPDAWEPCSKTIPA